MKRIYKILGLLVVFLAILTIKVNAASASLNLNKTSMKEGETVTATVKYTAAAWNLTVSADSGLTTTNTTKYADSSSNAENETKTFTVTYKASKTGTFNINLTGDVTDESASKATPVSEKKSITVKENVTTSDTQTPSATTTAKSTNANLKTLGVTPKQYDFSGFNKSKTDYGVTVPANVDKLEVIAKAEDTKAKVKVTGNSGFEVGSNNKIKVVVTAEDGKTTKTYTIKVTKLATEEEKPGNVIENENEKLYLTSLVIKDIELSPEFSKDVFSYTATLDDLTKNEVEIEAKANNSKAKVEITGNTNLVGGENTINIVVSLEESTEQTVYQIVLTKNETTALTTGVNGQDENNNSKNIMQGWGKYVVIAATSVILIILAIILLIFLIRKENKRLNEQNNEEEYDVFKNDEEEFKTNSVKDISNDFEEDSKKKGKPGRHF